MAQSGPGLIRLWNDFGGPEIPVANAVAYGTTAGGCNYYLGDFSVKGSLQDTDSGVVSVSKASGYARLTSSATADGDGVAFCSEIVFQPSLNGTMVLETRLERAALTAGVVFAGFTDTAADEIKEPMTSTGTTITAVASHYAGWLLDSQFTASTQWHMPFLGGSTTGPTTGATVAVGSGEVAVAAESDVLRIEIDTNGTARWFLNGNLEQTTEGAVSTTTLQAAVVGVWSTTTTVATADVDYVLVKANRDWTR